MAKTIAYIYETTSGERDDNYSSLKSPEGQWGPNRFGQVLKCSPLEPFQHFFFAHQLNVTNGDSNARLGKNVGPLKDSKEETINCEDLF